MKRNMLCLPTQPLSKLYRCHKFQSRHSGYRQSHSPNCTGATSSTVCTVLPTQTLSKPYRCQSKLQCMHSATDTDTLQTVPVPQEVPLYPQCHRHRHALKCNSATTSSTVCTVPTNIVGIVIVHIISLHAEENFLMMYQNEVHES